MLVLGKQMGWVLLASMMVGAAWADPNRHSETKVMVFGGDEAEVIEMDQLEVGETRELTTDSGRNVLITRDDSGLVVEVDGELIEIPSSGAGFDVSAFAADAESVVVLEDTDETIEDGHRVVVKRKQIFADGTPVELDLLLSDLDLDLDRDKGASGDRGVVVIKKQVEISNEEI